MPKPQFPSRRFRGVGFTRDEVAELQGQFDRSDRTVQNLEIDHLKSLSSAKLKDYGRAKLARLADRGALVGEETESLKNDSGGLSEASGDLDLSSDDDDLTALTGEDPSASEA